MKMGRKIINKNSINDIFYKTNPRGGISLIVLVITIIVIIILAAAVIVSIINNNPISEANEARIKSDVANMQSIFTNAVGKVMAENKDTIKIEAGPLNTVTSGAKSAVGNAVYTLSDGIIGEIIFDILENNGLKYYTGSKLPLYKQKTTWYVDEDGIISLEVGNKKYGDGKIIKAIKIVTEVIPSEEYIKKNAIVKIEVSSEDEIESIKFGGNNIEVPEKKEGKVIVEVEVTENGTYEIEVNGKNGANKKVNVEVNVIEELNKNIVIKPTVTPINGYANANIGLEISYEGEIESIKINEGNITVPAKQNGKYVVTKGVNQNGEYNVEVVAKDGTKNKVVVKVNQITEDMEIWNKADMESFRNKANSGRTFVGRTVKVMQNFDLQGSASNQWVPINNFAGTFEGNKHTISNLYINSNAYRDSGLFSTNNGTIQNVVLSNVNITNTISTASGMSTTGGIVGMNNNTIINCGITNGTIIGQNTSRTNGFNWVSVGGIAGRNNSNIRGCYNKANISAKDFNSNANYYYACSTAGGIAGSLANPTNTLECYNTGSVYGIATSSFRGGIVGICNDASSSSSYSTISNCYSIGSVSGTGERGNYQAGIVARNGWTSATYNKIINNYTITNPAYYHYNSGIKPNATGCISAANMKNYASNLGSAFKSDTSNKNGGYPILSWQ